MEHVDVEMPRVGRRGQRSEERDPENERAHERIEPEHARAEEVPQDDLEPRDAEHHREEDAEERPFDLPRPTIETLRPESADEESVQGQPDGDDPAEDEEEGRTGRQESQRERNLRVHRAGVAFPARNSFNARSTESRISRE